MMRWVALAVAALLLAGCGGKDTGANKVRLGDGNQVSLDLRPDQQPDPDDLYGAISGIVVNDAIYPIAGANVSLRGLGRGIDTDSNGRFVFERVPPGLWVAVVHKDGHLEGLGTLNVKSGDVAKAVLMAKRVPYVAPYHQTVEFQTFASANAFIDGRPEYVVGLDGNVQDVIVEALWSPLTSPSNPLRYRIEPERAGETHVLTGTSANPMRFAVPDDNLPIGTYAVRVQVYPDLVTAPPESSGRIFVTSFYVEPAPDGWSFVRGDG